jgi:hypothetical protein
MKAASTPPLGSWACHGSPHAGVVHQDIGARQPGGSDKGSFHPGDSSRAVFCLDVETISLLQARLIELDEDISIVLDHREFIGNAWVREMLGIKPEA